MGYMGAYPRVGACPGHYSISHIYTAKLYSKLMYTYIYNVHVHGNTIILTQKIEIHYMSKSLSRF